MSKIAVLATGVAAIAAVTLAAPTAASAAKAKVTKVTIVAANAIKTYGGADPAFGYTVYGLAKGDSLTRRPTCAPPSHPNAGKYTISCRGAQANSKKYTIAYSAGTLYVGRANLYVTPTYQQRYYGEADPELTYTVYGLVKGDALTRTPTCAVTTVHQDAGRYKTSCTGAAASSNYNLQTYEGLFDVLRRPLAVGPNPQAIYFGSPDPSFTYQSLGLATGDKLAKEPTCSVKAEHVHAGVYPITCTGAEASSNYLLSVLEGKYTIVANQSAIAADKATISKNLLGQPTAATLRAQLFLAYPNFRVFPGEKLTFTSGATTLCEDVVTDENGYANCKLGSNVSTLVKNGSYTVSYAGQSQGDKIDIEKYTVTVDN